MRQLVQKEVLLVSGAGSCGSSRHARKSCSQPSTPKTGCTGTPTPPVVTPPVTPPDIN
jgi:hypothetical protein